MFVRRNVLKFYVLFNTVLLVSYSVSSLSWPPSWNKCLLTLLAEKINAIWPRPWSRENWPWPRPHPLLASLTSLLSQVLGYGHAAIWCLMRALLFCLSRVYIIEIALTYVLYWAKINDDESCRYVEKLRLAKSSKNAENR